MGKNQQPNHNKKLFPCTEFEEVVYLLQGGGALGAFQVGVYQALEEHGFAPDWLVGISIGAINSAIIAGNPPKKRLEKLMQFWDLVTHKIEPQLGNYEIQEPNLIQAYNLCSALFSLNFGQTEFFNPKLTNPWWQDATDPNQISYYDTSKLKKTLEKVIDFEYLTQAQTRLSLGAVDIETGKLIFFDNKKQQITPEHIMASCALPPGFPAVKIKDKYYWDGGLYSNTPLIAVINDLPHKSRLCFLVDLFDSTGVLPHSMDDVLERAKDITYAGQLDLMLDYYDLLLLMQKKIANCIAHLPQDMQQDPYIKDLGKLGDAHNVHITKIVHRSNLQELHSKDYEFSHFNARRRIAAGYQHVNDLLADPNWWQRSEENVGTLVHSKAEDLHIVVGSCSCKKDPN
jgi:NTE family protein